MMHPEEKDNDIERVRWFLAEGIWDIELSSLSWLKRVGVNAVRVIHLVYRGFRGNECPLHASALTFMSLMSIVPVLAFALALLRGLGAGELAEQKIIQSMELMPEQFQTFVVNILDYVGNTNFTTLGGIGLVFLLVTVIMVMGRVETSFNRVWGVSASRQWLRKFSGYISILIVVPVLVMAATTINAMLTSPGIALLIETRLGPVSFLYLRSRTLTPLLATWAAFIFLYKFMPNTRVRVMPAILSGVIGGSLWIGWQWLYINLQVGVTQYNKIYGTFASIPVFLIWLYVSWQIVLLGAEIGFALQNYSTYKMEQRAHRASPQSRIVLALSIVCRAAQAMIGNLPQFEIAAYAREHQVPTRLINEVVEELIKAGLMAGVAERDGSFVLVKVPDKVRVKDVMDVILQSGSSPRSLGLDRLSPALRDVLSRFEIETDKLLKDISVTDLLQLESAPPEPKPRADIVGSTPSVEGN